MDPKRLKQLEKGNTRLKKLLAEKGAGPVDSPGGGGGKLLSPARARHRPLHWRQLPAVGLTSNYLYSARSRSGVDCAV